MIKLVAVILNLILLINFVLTGCEDSKPQTTSQQIEDEFQNVVDSVYGANPESLGVMVHVESPDWNVSWSYAAGVTERNTGQTLDKDQPVLIASNTKTYVAATILILIEQDRLKLDQSITSLVSEKSAKLFKEDGYNLDLITVKHLLSHTSGIADYVDSTYFSNLNIDPEYQWTRDEQIELSVEVGSPLAVPGRQFKYADINYLLLTEIIENITEQPFYEAIRDLIDYEKHRLNSTWFIDLENKPKNILQLAHQYDDKNRLNSYKINPSWDLYGGGGLATTSKDLAQFFQLLFTGKIIRDKQLLNQMHRFVLPEEESVYCLGIRKINFNDLEAYYHGGFWGTDVMYVPELNTSISIFTLVRDKRDINIEINKSILEKLKKQIMVEI